MHDLQALQRLWQHGIALARDGRHDEAIAWFRSLSEQHPSLHEARIQTAQLLLMQDRYRDARQLALEVAACPGLNVEQAVANGRILRQVECSPELARMMEAVDWRQATAAQLYEAARMLASAGLHARARPLVERGLALPGDAAHGLYMRGSIELFAGEMASANEDFHASIARDPGRAPAHWMLSLTSEAAHRDHDIDAIVRVLPRTDPDGEDAVYLHYALHNHFHAAGRTDEAWQALQSACALKRRRTVYDEAGQMALMDAIEALQLPVADAAGAPDGSPSLVFIVGMHRSGTTVLERMLAGHTQVCDGGETYAFTAQMSNACDHLCQGVVDATILARSGEVDWQEVAEGFRAYARWRAGGKAVLTEKLPSNFLQLGFILRALPEARVLHMRRDPMDTCFSNLRTYFSNAAPYSYDQRELATYFQRYRRLMAHWSASAPGRVLDIDYARLVEDPAGQARQIFDFCGLPFEAGALDVARQGGVVATASVAHARDGIRRDRGQAWKPYQAHLAALIEGLAPA